MSLNQLLAAGSKPWSALNCQTLNVAGALSAGSFDLSGDLKVNNITATGDISCGVLAATSGISLADGAGAGKVLTSDAFGNGSWQVSGGSAAQYAYARGTPSLAVPQAFTGLTPLTLIPKQSGGFSIVGDELFPPLAGTYQVTAGVSIQNSDAVSNYAYAYLERVNAGVPQEATAALPVLVAPGQIAAVTVSAIMTFGAGESVRAPVFSNLNNAVICGQAIIGGQTSSYLTMTKLA